jgi:hypothetical protein
LVSDQQGVKSFHPKIPHAKSLNLLMAFCSFMSLIFCIWIESIKVFLCMINYLSLLVETSAGFMFLQFFSFENKLKLKTYFISEENGQHKGRDRGREDRYREPFSSRHIQL